MRRLVHLLLGGLPTTPAGTRALAATMADWRHETAKGGSLPNRLRGNAVGMWSVCPASIYSAMLITALLGPASRDVAILYWPIRLHLALLSVTVLPLVLAGYLARQTKRRDLGAGSAVPS